MMHGPGGGRRRGGPMGRGKPEKAHNIRATLKKLIAYMSDYKGSLIIVLILAIASTAAMIVGPKIMGRATDRKSVV